MSDEIGRLRVLIANESSDRSEVLGQLVADLGHDGIVVADITEIAEVTAREAPDVALVGLELHTERALELVQVVRDADCPVIAVLSDENPEYIHEAAKRGVFAYVVETGSDELKSALDITLRRFAEYHNLQGAMGRRVAIEQAKGILMARSAVDADGAFGMLRDHSQRQGVKIAEVAESVIDVNPLLPPTG